jgi:hypothetical protein
MHTSTIADNGTDETDRDIKAEIAAMEQKQELHTGRLVLNSIQGLDAATDCCRRVQGHLERLKVSGSGCVGDGC